MKSFIVLALASSTIAVPLGSVIDAIFGTQNQARQAPPPNQISGAPPLGTGSGLPFPFPTATGSGAFPFPTASGGAHHHHHGHHVHRTKSLVIDYQLAPTALPKRQEGGSALPSFTLLDPTDGVPGVSTTAIPTSTEDAGVPTGLPSGFPIPSGSADSPFPFPTGGFPMPSGNPDSTFPFPTGGFPSGGFPSGGFPTGSLAFPMPTGGFPGTGFSGFPTTMQTFTRGPRPTAAPETPSQEDGEQGSGSEGFFSWLEGLFGGGKSETSN